MTVEFTQTPRGGDRSSFLWGGCIVPLTPTVFEKRAKLPSQRQAIIRREYRKIKKYDEQDVYPIMFQCRPTMGTNGACPLTETLETWNMKHVEKVETFGQLLLAEVEMCYSAAVVLTRDPSKARDLTREAVTQTWHLRDGADDTAGLRMTLLTVLQEKYVQHKRLHTLGSMDDGS